jgi:Family of unknown function (DUF6600)/FecR protein
MKPYKNFAVTVVALALACILAAPSFAQDQAQPQDQDEQDPPNRVAQLNYTSGSVSFQPGGEGDWVTAVQNRPLTTGDNLWADKDSRAELHIGSTAIRMDSETSMTFLELNDNTTQLRLSAGTVILRVRHLDDGDTFEVDTPNLAFDVQRTGEYRVDVNPDGGETLVTIWHGRGEVTGGGESYTVIADQQARFTGTDQLDHEISQVPASDDFDTWAFQRDDQEDRAESANYISTEVTGYQDLDAYGRWHYVGGYGTVWSPAGVAGDWAPYRYGHWVWIAPWGWTWVEDEAWGFAPFHYGRWAYVESSWCWVPGPVAVRPIYAPAFVAFVGGDGFSLSVGVGGGPGVGWFPLAPGEVYVPYYHASRAYVNNINITNTRVNVTQITNVYNVYNNHQTNVTRITYVNQRDPRFVTVVSRDTFVNARPVYRNVVHVDERTIVQAPVGGRLDFQPSRNSVIGAGRPATYRPPATVIDRRVVATHMPTGPQRPNFEQRQPEMNVRTERPVTAQPPARAENPAPRPGVPIDNRAHPEGGQQNRQPEAQGNFPHPQNERNTEPVPQQNNPQRDEHSYVRQAPPVQQRSPQQQQNEEQKFRNWQTQRDQHQSQPQARPESKPQPRAPQQHTPPAKSHHEDKPNK